MEYFELTPEEKLMFAIFGESACMREEPHHWLSEAGRKAVNDLLIEVAASGGIARLAATPEACKRGIRVLRLRFGFDPRTPEEKAKRLGSSDTRTLDEVKVYFGVTRERVRQIESRMLRALRHPSRSRNLRPYLEDPEARF